MKKIIAIFLLILLLMSSINVNVLCEVSEKHPVYDSLYKCIGYMDLRDFNAIIYGLIVPYDQKQTGSFIRIMLQKRVYGSWITVCTWDDLQFVGNAAASGISGIVNGEYRLRIEGGIRNEDGS